MHTLGLLVFSTSDEKRGQNKYLSHTALLRRNLKNAIIPPIIQLDQVQESASLVASIGAAHTVIALMTPTLLGYLASNEEVWNALDVMQGDKARKLIVIPLEHCAWMETDNPFKKRQAPIDWPVYARGDVDKNWLEAVRGITPRFF